MIQSTGMTTASCTILNAGHSAEEVFDATSVGETIQSSAPMAVKHRCSCAHQKPLESPSRDVSHHTISRHVTLPHCPFAWFATLNSLTFGQTCFRVSNIMPPAGCACVRPLSLPPARQPHDANRQVLSTCARAREGATQQDHHTRA